MIEIKFRAWCEDSEGKRFYYFTLQEILERRMNYRGNWDEQILRGVKQGFIGLLDRNGKEIYEGDMFQYEEDGLLIVRWESLKAKFVLDQYGRGYYTGENSQEIEGDFQLLDTLGLDDFTPIYEWGEVFGNICEHSHLLKKN